MERQELEKVLIEDGRDKTEVQAMSLSTLIAECRDVAFRETEEEVDEQIFENLQILEPEDTIDTTKAFDRPSMDDEGWQDYVMGLFRERELSDGNPNVNGLRRVARKLLGHFEEDSVHTVCWPNDSNGGMAVVEATIIIEGYGRYSDVADASKINCKSPFLNHPTSTAASKAASRALRKALGLHGILSAEEATPEGVESPEKIVYKKVNSEDSISGITVRGIDFTCKRLNINVIEYLNSFDKHYNSLTEITSDEGDKMNEFLNNNQESLVEKEELKGYDPNWKMLF